MFIFLKIEDRDSNLLNFKEMKSFLPSYIFEYLKKKRWSRSRFLWFLVRKGDGEAAGQT